MSSSPHFSSFLISPKIVHKMIVFSLRHRYSHRCRRLPAILFILARISFAGSTSDSVIVRPLAPETTSGDPSVISNMEETSSRWKLESSTKCIDIASPKLFPLPFPPPPPTITETRAFSATDGESGSNEIHVSFDSPEAGGVDRFEVHLDEAFAMNVDYTESGTHRAVLAHLTPNTFYYVLVRACNAGGCGTFDIATKRSAPEVSRGLRAPVVFIGGGGYPVVMMFQPLKIYQRLKDVVLSLFKATSTHPRGRHLRDVFFSSFLVDDAGFRPPSVVDDSPSGKAVYFVKSRFPEEIGAPEAWSNDSVVDFTLSDDCSHASRGCASFLLPPSTPRSVAAPRVFGATADAFNVNWNSPDEPHGVVVSFGVLVFSVARGKEKEVEFRPDQFSSTIKGLYPATVYEIRLRVCVDLAEAKVVCVVSEKGATVTTAESLPTGQPPPVVLAATPTSVRLMWRPPSKPKGRLVGYVVFRDNLLMHETSDVATEKSTILDEGLEPFSEHSYRVAALNAEAKRRKDKGAISDSVVVRTAPGAPLEVEAPLVRPLDSTSVSVAWNPDQSSSSDLVRGHIEARRVQISLKDNGHLISDVLCPNFRQPEVEFRGLLPYTEYAVRIAVQNEVAQKFSAESFVRTKMASPSDLQPLKVETLDGGTEALVSWEEPENPRGEISEYRLFLTPPSGVVYAVYSGLRQLTMVSDLRPATSYDLSLRACTSGGCSDGDVYSFETRSAAPDGLLAPQLDEQPRWNRVAVMWTPPSIPNGEVVLFRLLKSLGIGRQRREEVSADSSGCLPSPVLLMETREIKDRYVFVDTDVQPAMVYAYQVVVHNADESSRSPCLVVTTPDSVPVGLDAPEVRILSSYEVEVKWLPPRSANGRVLHYELQRNSYIPLYFDGATPRFFVDTNLIPWTQYSYRLRACNAAGCVNSGATFTQTPMAAPDKVPSPEIVDITSESFSVKWTPTEIPNGIVDQYQLLVDGNSVFVGSSLNATVKNLEPYVVYELAIQACTDRGRRCSKGPSIKTQTSGAAPRELDAPFLNVLGPLAIQVSWSPPRRPNGRLLQYKLYRDNQQTPIFSGSDLSYTERGLDPGVEYKYWVSCSNGVPPSAKSRSSATTTFASAPEGQEPPELRPLSSSTVKASWKEPKLSNGVVMTYRLFRDDRLVVCEGLVLKCVVDDLKPFSNYRFRVQSCTSRGCVQSSNAYVRSLEAPPDGMDKPVLVASSTGVRIRWKLPATPNAPPQSLFYCVERSEVLSSTDDAPLHSRLIYRGSFTFHEDAALPPFSLFAYRVIVENSAGNGTSGWQKIRTASKAPSSLEPPRVVQVTVGQVVVELLPPNMPNGDIVASNVLVNGARRGTAAGQHLVVVDGLVPNSRYEIAAESCTSGGCVLSSPTVIVAQSTPPQGLVNPTVEIVSPTSVLVKWRPPRSVNGVLQRFELRVGTVCPQPPQPVSSSCSAPDPTLRYIGNRLSTILSDLTPYSAYSLFIRVHNTDAASDSESVPFRTPPAPPAAVKAPSVDPGLTKDAVDVQWKNSFLLNDRLKRYSLYVNGDEVFKGLVTTFVLKVEGDADDILEIRASVETERHPVAVTTPSVFYDVALRRVLFAAPKTTNFYRQAWFFVVVIVAAFAVVVVIVVVVVRRCKTKRGKSTPRSVASSRTKLPLPPRKRQRTLADDPVGDATFLEAFEGERRKEKVRPGRPKPRANRANAQKRERDGGAHNPGAQKKQIYLRESASYKPRKRRDRRRNVQDAITHI